MTNIKTSLNIFLRIIEHSNRFPVDLIYYRGHTFMRSSRCGGRGGQVKSGQNSDGVDCYRGEGERIHRNWMSRAKIGIGVIRVQTVFQIGVWFCYKCSRLVSDSAISVTDRCLVPL